MNRRIVSLAVVVVGALGCSLLSLPETNGTVGIGGGAPLDGGGGTTDAAPKDASDANDAGFSCAGHGGALFCADFEADPFNQAFVTTQQLDGGTVAPGPGLYGRGAVATLIPRADGPRPSASLVGDLGVAHGTSFTLAYDVFFDSPIGAGTIDSCGFLIGQPDYYQATIRSYDDGHVVLHEYLESGGMQTNNDLPLKRAPVSGAWVHVEIVVTFTAGASTATVRFDGQEVLSAASILAWKSGGKASLVAGIWNGEGPSARAVTVRVDDVLATSP